MRTVFSDGECVHGLDVIVGVGGRHGGIEHERPVSPGVAVVGHQLAHIRLVGQILEKTEHYRPWTENNLMEELSLNLWDKFCVSIFNQKCLILL